MLVRTVVWILDDASAAVWALLGGGNLLALNGEASHAYGIPVSRRWHSSESEMRRGPRHPVVLFGAACMAERDVIVDQIDDAALRGHFDRW